MLVVLFGNAADLSFFLPSLIDYDLCWVCKDYSSLKVIFKFFFFIDLNINFSISLLHSYVDLFNPLSLSKDQSDESYAFVRSKVCWIPKIESSETLEYIAFRDFSKQLFCLCFREFTSLQVKVFNVTLQLQHIEKKVKSCFILPQNVIPAQVKRDKGWMSNLGKGMKYSFSLLCCLYSCEQFG